MYFSKWIFSLTKYRESQVKNSSVEWIFFPFFYLWNSTFFLSHERRLLWCPLQQKWTTYNRIETPDSAQIWIYIKSIFVHSVKRINFLWCIFGVRVQHQTNCAKHDESRGTFKGSLRDSNLRLTTSAISAHNFADWLYYYSFRTKVLNVLII